jgi:hypothetical protein
MKRLLLLLIAILFTSCWIEPKIGDYEKKDNICYCDNYETLRSLIVPEINNTFPTWHWSNNVFDEKYNKYLHNIPVSKDWITHLKKTKYEYLYFTGTTSDKIQCYNSDGKRAYIEGKYVILIRNNGDAITFFENNHLINEHITPVVELPCTLSTQ